MVFLLRWQLTCSDPNRDPNNRNIKPFKGKKRKGIDKMKLLLLKYPFGMLRSLISGKPNILLINADFDVLVQRQRSCLS